MSEETQQSQNKNMTSFWFALLTLNATTTTADNDWIDVGENNNVVFGQDAKDYIKCGSGNDTVCGDHCTATFDDKVTGNVATCVSTNTTVGGKFNFSASLVMYFI